MPDISNTPNMQPASGSQFVPAVQPVADAQSVAGGQSVPAAQPVAGTQPAHSAQPAQGYAAAAYPAYSQGAYQAAPQQGAYQAASQQSAYQAAPQQRAYQQSAYPQGVYPQGAQGMQSPSPQGMQGARAQGGYQGNRLQIAQSQNARSQASRGQAGRGQASRGQASRGQAWPQATNTTLPQNIEAEQTVLSACLLSLGVFEEVVQKLKPESFFRPAHRIIFETMREMTSKSIPIDVISVADQLTAKNQLEAVGGQAYLLELTDNTFALTNWNHHADIVARDAIRRDLLYASASISALAYDSPADTTELIGKAEASLFGVTEQRVASTFKSIVELVEQTNNEIADMANRDTAIQGVQTGFIDVDKLFCGLRGGDLIILAARPAVGKTSFAMNLAANAAKIGSTVVLFSLEMSSVQITQRIIASEAQVPLHRLRSGQLSEADMLAIVNAEAGLTANNTLYIDDSPSLTITELRTKARRLFRDVKNGLIIVDYLQLMQPVIPRPNARQVEVAEISRGLKVLAKELDIPIIALSQLSRSIDTRGDKRPMLSDLRESGSIEQDADIVMFLDRSTSEAEAESDKRPDLGEAELIVAKHRNGPTRDIKLTFVGEYTKFTNYFDDSSYGGYAE